MKFIIFLFDLHNESDLPELREQGDSESRRCVSYKGIETR